jgi:hypothetical protein
MRARLIGYQIRIRWVQWDRLCMLKPLGEALTFEKEGRSLFRGCAGPAHSMGMSWTLSLDKEI